jgi:hypothetical protein
MMPARECYQHAEHCEDLARDLADELNRRLLVSLAQQWRLLGDETKMHGVRTAQLGCWPPKPVT